MSVQKFPIWISDISELDLVYEGLHLVSQAINFSNLELQRQQRSLEYELKLYLEEEMMSSEVAIKAAHSLRDKKIIIRELAKKSERVHLFLKRLSDPSVPPELVDDFKERKQRELLLESISEGDKAFRPKVKEQY